MPKIAYLTGSKTDQQDQLNDIKSSGFSLTHDARDWYLTETPSEFHYKPLKRKVFKRVIDGSPLPFTAGSTTTRKVESGDRLIVTAMCALGRTTVEVIETVELLRGRGVFVQCLELGADPARDELTQAPVGRKLMAGLAATVALENAERIRRRSLRKINSKKLGRRNKLKPGDRAIVLDRLAQHGNVTKVAMAMSVSRQTIRRIRDGASPEEKAASAAYGKACAEVRANATSVTQPKRGHHHHQPRHR